jgi:hypothetical protein
LWGILKKGIMRKGISLIMLLMIFVSSCSSNNNTEKVEDQGKVIVKNGKNENDTITFSCVGCTKHIKEYSVFKKIVEEAGNKTKSALHFPLSFNPEKLDLTIIKQDSMYYFDNNKKIENLLFIISDYKYVAKNSYGNELEGSQLNSFYVKDNNVVELEDKIKLEDLRFNDEINRTFSSVRNNEEFIEFIPLKDKSIIVKSSLNCVDEGTNFMFILENEKEINLYSWNDFNCEGNSYFEWFNKEQIESLKLSRIKYMYINSDGESVMVNVPKNQSDYMQQLLNLF